jgi:hypothetical protein
MNKCRSLGWENKHNFYPPYLPHLINILRLFRETKGESAAGAFRKEKHGKRDLLQSENIFHSWKKQKKDEHYVWGSWQSKCFSKRLTRI